jgi:hypothetical protein
MRWSCIATRMTSRSLPAASWPAGRSRFAGHASGARWRRDRRRWACRYVTVFS